MSNESEIVANPVSVEGVAKYCANCGIEFKEAIPSNSWFKCDICEAILLVRSK
jgi:hypothetical protein